MKKIKILYIHHAQGWGGAPINLRNIIENLDKAKFDVHVLLLKNSVVREKFLEKGISVSVCESVFYTKYYKYLAHSDAGSVPLWSIFRLIRVFTSWYLSKYFFAEKVLKLYDFDIVHLNSSVLSDWLYPASRMGKVVYHVQEPLSKGLIGVRYSFIRSEVKAYADKVLAISEDNASRINLDSKTVVLRNFINIPSDMISTIKNHSILYVGGFSKIKGISVMLDAIPMINTDIKIVLAGNFPDLTKSNLFKDVLYLMLFPQSFFLRRKFKNISSLKNVEVVGQINDIGIELVKSKVLVSPFSAPHFSRPVIESFAYGKPVVVSDVKGMIEIVDHGINGFITKIDDAAELAGAINTLVSNDLLLLQMGINAKKRAELIYSPTVNMIILESVYLELIKN